MEETELINALVTARKGGLAGTGFQGSKISDSQYPGHPRKNGLLTLKGASTQRWKKNTKEDKRRSPEGVGLIKIP